MNAIKQPADLVLDAAGVAALIGLPSEDAFYRRRAALEASGFPQKLPGLPRWSRACVLRWIETNGETFLPAAPAAAVSPVFYGGDIPLSLEEAYAHD